MGFRILGLLILAGIAFKPEFVSAATGPITRPDGYSPPPVWSPDGQWLAFTAAEDKGDWLFPTGWLVSPIAGGIPRTASRQQTLWVVRVRDGRFQAVVERPLGQLSQPAWSADGRCLYWQEFAPSEAAAPILENNGPITGQLRLLRWGLDAKLESLVDRLVVLTPADQRRLIRSRVAPSPDGLKLAIDDFSPRRLRIVSTTEPDRAVVELPNAGHPLWSPDSTRLLGYVVDGQSAGYDLFQVDRWATSQRIVTTADEWPEPRFEANSKRLLAIVFAESAQRATHPQRQIEILRIAIDAPRPRRWLTRAVEVPSRLTNWSPSFDHQTTDDSVTLVLPGVGGSCGIERLRLDRSTQLPLTHPLDRRLRHDAIPLGGLAQNPRDPGVLALRWGVPDEAGGPVVLVSLEREADLPGKHLIITPGAALAWRGTWVFVEALLREFSESDSRDDGPFAPATFPAVEPSEARPRTTTVLALLEPVSGNDRQAIRRQESVAHIAGLLEQQLARLPNTPTARRLRLDARILITYARREFTSCLTAIDQWEADQGPDRTDLERRLVAVARVQTLWALGEVDQAKAQLANLLDRFDREPMVMPAENALPEPPSTSAALAERLEFLDQLIQGVVSVRARPETDDD